MPDAGTPVKNKIVGNKNNATNTSAQMPVTLRFSRTEVLAVRMIIYANGGDSHYTEMREVELYDGATKILGLTATAVNSDPSYPPSGLIDGDPSFTAYGFGKGWYSSGVPSLENPAIVMLKVASPAQIDAFRFMTGKPDGTTVSYPNAQPMNFEIQFTSDPTAVAGDPLDSAKWFGLDLINGKADGSEKSVSNESTMKPVLPTADLVFAMYYVTTPIVDLIEINFGTVPRYETTPIVDLIEVGYTAEIDNGFQFVLQQMEGGPLPPAQAVYRSKLYTIEGFVPRVKAFKTDWFSGSEEFRLGVNLYAGDRDADVLSSKSPVYSEIYAPSALGDNTNLTTLSAPVSARYFQLEYVFFHTEGGDPSHKPMRVNEFQVEVDTDEYTASPQVSGATFEASTLVYKPSGSAILTFDTETENTYFSRVFAMLGRPTGTGVSMWTRSANHLEDLEHEIWLPHAPGANSPQIGRYVQIRVELTTSEGNMTPVVPHFGLTYTPDPDKAILPSFHKVKTDMLRYVFDVKALTQMNRQNLTAMYVDVFEDMSGLDTLDGATVLPVTDGKAIVVLGSVPATVESKTQVLPFEPNRFVFAAHDKGTVAYDLSLNGGLSWRENIPKDAQLNVLLEDHAGDELRIRARLLSMDAEVYAWGLIF